MKILKPLTDDSTKQDIMEALASLPAPGVKRIAKVLDVEADNNRFARMQEIFDKHTLPRIVNVYNTLVAKRNGDLEILQNTLQVGADVFKEILPIVEFLIENKGKVNFDEIKDFVLNKVNASAKNNPLADFRLLKSEAKQLGFTGKGNKETLTAFIEANKN